MGCQHFDVSKEAEAPLEAWNDKESGFRFLPGDELDIRFRYGPEFNDRVVVGPDGRIQLNLIGSVVAQDKTPAQLTSELRDRYAKDLRYPDLSVIPRAFGSETVYVSGEIGKPGRHRLVPGMTVTSSLIAAGGLLESANLEEVLLVRKTPRNTNMIRRIPLKDILEGSNFENDVTLQRFDVVIVPRSDIAEADRMTQQYVRKLLPFGSQVYVGVVPE